MLKCALENNISPQHHRFHKEYYDIDNISLTVLFHSFFNVLSVCFLTTSKRNKVDTRAFLQVLQEFI